MRTISRPSHRRTLGAALAAALVTAMVACSSSTTGSAGGGGSSDTSSLTGLAKAMSSVTATPSTEEYFEYGDLAAMRRLGLISSDAQKPPNLMWNRVTAQGSDQLSAYYQRLQQVIGLNVFAFDTAVTAGQAPNYGTRLDGTYDAQAVSKKLADLAAGPRTFGTVKGLSLAPDNSIDVSSQAAAQLGVTNQLNQMVVDGKRFVASPNAAGLDALLGGGRSLLSAGPRRDLTDCLGDVLAAAVLVPQGKNDTATLVGVGVRTPASATSARDEVVCAVPASGKSESVTTAFNQRLSLKATDTTGRPLSSYASAITVDADHGIVRAVLHMKAATPPGYVFTSLQTSAYEYWDGTCHTPSTRNC